MKLRGFTGLLLGVVILLGLLATGKTTRAGQDADGYKENMRKFSKTLALIEKKYVQPQSSEVLIRSAIDEMLYRLDPYTQFMDLRSHTELIMDTRGKYGGIGLSVDIRDNVLTAISPIEGTPAFKAGIQAGDRIVAIDGEPTQDLTIDECVDRLRGDPGTIVVMTVEREGFDEPIEFRLTRAVIEIKSVPYAAMLDDRVGYIKVAQFSQSTSRELETALEKLEKQGMELLLLDLRGNPGGLLDQAVRVVEKFIGAGKEVVSTRGRIPDSRRQWIAKRSATHPEFPLVILINGGSASASEIVAGAIQDWDRGIILGTTSFGKGSVQNVIELSDGGALKITIARYYTPSGRCIHKADNDYTREFFPEAGEAMKTHNIVDQGIGEYTTKINKRKVIGGGGIVPDITVKPDSLSPVMREIEIKAIPFKFAVTYTAQHEISDPDFMVTDAMLKAFQQLAQKEGVLLNEVKLNENKDDIIFSIRREIVAKLWGSDARYREVLKHDRQIAEALALLHDQAQYARRLTGDYTPVPSN
ncbi:MAG: S41 family peptidase [Gemmatimonadetes bacterium]|nr:MAG: S41 family peptidase [Gemmatimonadota bacterium]